MIVDLHILQRDAGLLHSRPDWEIDARELGPPYRSADLKTALNEVCKVIRHTEGVVDLKHTEIMIYCRDAWLMGQAVSTKRYARVPRETSPSARTSLQHTQNHIATLLNVILVILYILDIP